MAACIVKEVWSNFAVKYLLQGDNCLCICSSGVGFHAGELRVCHVSDVRMLLPTKSSNPVTLAVGHLVCSNFRLKFIPLVEKLQVVIEEI